MGNKNLLTDKKSELVTGGILGENFYNVISDYSHGMGNHELEKSSVEIPLNGYTVDRNIL